MGILNKLIIRLVLFVSVCRNKEMFAIFRRLFRRRIGVLCDKFRYIIHDALHVDV